jgi:hypothetical protein
MRTCTGRWLIEVALLTPERYTQTPCQSPSHITFATVAKIGVNVKDKDHYLAAALVGTRSIRTTTFNRPAATDPLLDLARATCIDVLKHRSAAVTDDMICQCLPLDIQVDIQAMIAVDPRALRLETGKYTGTCSHVPPGDTLSTSWIWPIWGLLITVDPVHAVLNNSRDGLELLNMDRETLQAIVRAAAAHHSEDLVSVGSRKVPTRCTMSQKFTPYQPTTCPLLANTVWPTKVTNPPRLTVTQSCEGIQRNHVVTVGTEPEKIVSCTSTCDVVYAPVRLFPGKIHLVITIRHFTLRSQHLVLRRSSSACCITRKLVS